MVKTARRTKVPRIEVKRRGDRDPLAVPDRLRKPGKRYRWMGLGDSPSETEAKVEELIDLGYHPVTKDGKPDSAQVQHRNMLLFEIDEKLYQRRQDAKVRENIQANKAQAAAIRQTLRSRIGASEGRVIGRGLEYAEPENLLTTSERFEPGEAEA